MTRKRISIRTVWLAPAILLLCAANALAAEVMAHGKLTVPEGEPLFAVATDPIVQRVLEQDFRGAHRAEPASRAPITITVTVNQKLLSPGITLGQLGPGDPLVIARLMRAAGVEPPPLGDSGEETIDPFAASAQRHVMQPDDPMAEFRDYQAAKQAFYQRSGPRFGPNGNASPSEIYDTVVVARATSSNSPDELEVLAVIHPGDDLRAAKELVAEQIANAVLH